MHDIMVPFTLFEEHTSISLYERGNLLLSSNQIETIVAVRVLNILKVSGRAWDPSGFNLTTGILK